MLEKKIEELGEYFDGMFRLDNMNNVIRIVIPGNWVVYDKTLKNGVIKSRKHVDNNKTKVLFVGSENVKIGEIMDFAIEIIYANIEIQSKKELFQKKVKELGDIFDTNKLSVLENLVFKIEKPKKVNKKVETTDGDDEIDKLKTDVGADTDVNVEFSEDDIETKINNAIENSKK